MNVDFGKLYLIGEDGVPHVIEKISEIKDVAFDNAAETLFGGWDKVEEVIDEAIIPPDEERYFNLPREYSFTAQIDEDSPFIKEIQNQHKKYLRDKAQYKFWKDQEFIGNNRAGRRRK